MSTKVKAFIVVVGVLLVVTVISLIIFSRGPIYSQAAEDNWVPDLTGEWISPGAGYGYDDVFDLAELPMHYPDASLSDDGYVIITHQTGRTFAGTYEEGDGKLTGVMLPDRTVSIQFFELTEGRIFFTGRMTRSGGTLEISGYAHQFDDFGIRPDPDTEMASGYVRLIKVN